MSKSKLPCAVVLMTGVIALAVCAPEAVAQKFSRLRGSGGPVFGGPAFAGAHNLDGQRPRPKRLGRVIGQTGRDKTPPKDQKPPKSPPKTGNDDGPAPKDNRPPKTNDDHRPPVRVVCEGGRVVAAACICPPGERVRGAGARRFVCETIVVVKPPRTPPVIVATDPKPKPKDDPPLVREPKRPPPNDPPRVVREPSAPPSTVVAQLGGRATPPSLPSAVRALPPRGPIPVAPPATIAAAGGEVLPDEVIVTIAANAPASAEADMARRYNIQIVERITLPLVGVRAMRCRWPAGSRLPDVIARLRSDPRTIEAQGNYIYRPSQGALAAAPVVDLQYAIAKLELSDAHTLSTGRGARVAIIDSGVDAKHPDFAGATVESFDALGGTKTDAGTHGTAIAGIISARGTLRGIAPAAILMSIRAFPSDRGTEPQMTTTLVLLKSMDWAIANGARVLNLSLAGPRDPLMEKAVAAAAAKGVIMVAAAGNNGDKAPPAYPAAYRDVIAVTAIDARDQLYKRANHGRYIAIAAPGVDVLAPARGKGHDLQSGTSFAAAHVSGILALMLERNPELTAETARRALVESAVDLGEPGQDESFGAGRTSAAAALRWVAKYAV